MTSASICFNLLQVDVPGDFTKVFFQCCLQRDVPVLLSYICHAQAVTVTADGYDKDFRFSFSHDWIPLTSLPFAAVDHSADDVPEGNHVAHLFYQDRIFPEATEASDVYSSSVLFLADEVNSIIC